MKLKPNFKSGPANSSGSLIGLSRLDMLAVVAATALCFLVLGLFSLASPTTKLVQTKIPYHQYGTYSYEAPVSPSSPYGTSKLVTGNPVLMSDLKNLQIGLNYQLTAKEPLQVAGTEQLVMQIQDSGITRTLPIQPAPVPFSGSKVSLTGSLEMSQLASIYNSLATAFAGSLGTQMTVLVFPNIESKGAIAGHSFSSSFNSPLTFSLSNSVLQLSNPSSQNSGIIGVDSTTSQLTPSTDGSVTYSSLSRATLPLNVVHPSVFTGRIIALAGLIVCIIFGVWIAWPLRRNEDRESRMIDARYGPRLIPVGRISIQTSAVVSVDSIAVLISLANKYGVKVLHSIEDGTDRYAIIDNGVLYQYMPPVSENLGSITEREKDRLASREVILDGMATK